MYISIVWYWFKLKVQKLIDWLINVFFTLPFQEVILYIGTTKSFEEIPNKKIHWPKRDTHPKDTPDCGFDGSLCKTESKPNESFLISISYAKVGCNIVHIHSEHTSTFKVHLFPFGVQCSISPI